MINDLMGIIALAGKELTALVDQMKNMCVAIRAINNAQFPTDIAMIGVLKKSFQIRFKTLTAGIKLVSHNWSLPL